MLFLTLADLARLFMWSEAIAALGGAIIMAGAVMMFTDEFAERFRKRIVAVMTGGAVALFAHGLVMVVLFFQVVPASRYRELHSYAEKLGPEAVTAIREAIGTTGEVSLLYVVQRLEQDVAERRNAAAVATTNAAQVALFD